VIGAGQALGVALLFAADDGAAVRTGVEVHLDRAVLGAPQKQLPAAHLARHEIAGLGDFGRVTGVQPAAAENLGPLLVQHGGVGKRPARHQKLAALRVDADEMGAAKTRFDGLVHGSLQDVKRVPALADRPFTLRANAAPPKATPSAVLTPGKPQRRC
jgi:hypothetical protein